MGSDMQQFLMMALAVLGGITIFVLAIVFIAVPVFKGIGVGIGAIFTGIGWVFSHVFGFIFGVLGDLLRFIGSLLAMAVFLPLVPLNIVIGRWSASAHYASMFKHELPIAAGCVYRAVIQRPLKLVLLHGLLEGLEQRVPEAMAAAPTADAPSRRAGQFDGYTIIGSLKAGGSGAKLYIAAPAEQKRAKNRHMGDRVVIKSFALTEGSSLPQIVRESRALECAKQMGLVLEHGMDEHRFFYVMPYHPGDHLGILTRKMHGESGGGGLDERHLRETLGYTRDLLRTLACYHKGGLWHKDVKPENVIVHDGRAHLVDLGLVTPLRSAMTLTTHGTEYFRDPEMVRQALRGVRVHQVDGAKFDVYAVGAVLYFMIENTFPAHGGLSRFGVPSPEALRWVVRRAMTEYHQRYETVDHMLADIDHISGASDLFTVKPADLPSMRAGSALSGMPPMMAGDAADEPAWSATANPEPRVAPKLRVTNWWTGAYEVDGQRAPVGSDASPRGFRQQAFAFRQQAAEISRQAREGALSARRAAREQVKAARRRAREIQRRASAHRHHLRHPQLRSGRLAIAIGLLCLIGLAAGLLFMVSFGRRTVGRDLAFAASAKPTLPLLLVVDSERELSDRARREIARVINDHDDPPYTILNMGPGLGRDYAPLVRDWRDDPKGDADVRLEALLADVGAYGILDVQVRNSDSQRPKVTSRILHSTAPDAELRGQTAGLAHVPNGPPSALPYLLLNDHPAKADVKVEAAVARIVQAYRWRGWKIDSNDDAEVQVRKLLPAGPIDRTTSISPVMNPILHDFGFGGVLRISARQGEGSPEQRIEVTLIDGDDTHAYEALNGHDPAAHESTVRPQSAASIGAASVCIEVKPALLEAVAACSR